MITTETLRQRIMKTMTGDLQVLLSEGACECIELAKELIEIIRQRNYTNFNRERVILEFADVLVMLVALEENLDITDRELIAAIIKVCEQYENPKVF